MRAVIGRYYKNLEKAFFKADEMEKMWKGRVKYAVVGNDENGYIVIPHDHALGCNSAKEKKL